MSQDIHGPLIGRPFAVMAGMGNPLDMEVSRWENHRTKQGIVRCKPCFSVPEGRINMDE